MFFSYLGFGKEMMKNEQAFDNCIKKIGQRLRKLRAEKGYNSYVDFAMEAEIQPKQYWKLEAGTANFTIRTLLRVLAVYDLSLEEFFSQME
ncbi:MAG: helix-turn-helix transcriptional regulator [Marinoscillum sp.]